jgi:hypothetical protein
VRDPVKNAPGGTGAGIQGKFKRFLEIASMQQAAQPMLGNDQGLHFPRPEGGGFEQEPIFAPGILSHAHVGAGAGEDGGECFQSRHGHAALEHSQHPLAITDVTPARVEEKAILEDDFPAKESSATQGRQVTGPGMIFQRHLDLSVTEVFSIGIDDHNIAKKNIDFGVFFEESGHLSEGARQILLVTIQIAKDVAGGAAEAAIDGVVHSLIFFHKGAHASILSQPIQGAVIGAGILNDMLNRNRLIGDGGDAEFKP